MRIPILTFGAIASIIAINSVFADTTVTSKQYVDTTRQATIPAAGTNYDENGGGVSVITYTEDAGVLGERGIFDAPINMFDSDDDGKKLITARAAFSAMPSQQKTVTHKQCVEWDAAGQGQGTDENCLLWNLIDVNVVTKQCTTNADCVGIVGAQCAGPRCRNGICACDNY